MNLDVVFCRRSEEAGDVLVAVMIEELAAVVTSDARFGFIFLALSSLEGVVGEVERLGFLLLVVWSVELIDDTGELVVDC